MLRITIGKSINQAYVYTHVSFKTPHG